MRYMAFLLALLATPTAASDSFDCVVDPSAEVKLGSPIAGLIAEVMVDRGDFVTAGQDVARLESSIDAASVELDVLQAESTEELNAAQTKLDLANSRLARTKALAEKGVATNEQVEQLSAEVQVAERERDLEVQKRKLAALELDRSRAQLARRTIRAPISGYIAARSLSAGEYVDQNASIVTLVALDPLRVETFLPVAYWQQVRPGMTANVSLIEPVAGVHPATVSVVDRVFDAASGTFGVRLSLANADGGLPAGQRCTVTFDLPAAP
jgi:RND family efflux transporter MFP subunit